MRADLASEVFIVAHSTGGLLARAAVSAGMDKLKRLVMLGTPNFGSFATAMVFRGVYPFLNKVAALDFRHSAAELAATVRDLLGLDAAPVPGGVEVSIPPGPGGHGGHGGATVTLAVLAFAHGWEVGPALGSAVDPGARTSDKPELVGLRPVTP